MAARVRPLDLLRALAVLLVLGRHFPAPPPGVAEPVRVVRDLWFQVGWMGVDLFFVLSGFLVAGLLFTEHARHGDVHVGRFLIRRGFKIYPAFYVLLLATLARQACAPGGLTPHHWTRLGVEALYLQNYWPGCWNHTWSLAVEEHFYLFLGLSILVATRVSSRGLRPLALLLFLLCLGVLALRTWIDAPGAQYYRYLFPSHLRVDSLLWGVLLSHAYHFGDPRWLRALRRAAPAVLVVSALCLWPPFQAPLERSAVIPTWGLTSLALGFTLLLALCLPDPEASPGPRSSHLLRPLGRLGADSYSIYLWHMPVVAWLMPALQQVRWLRFRDATTGYVVHFALYVAACVGIGMALALIVERPALRLRDRLFPSRAGALRERASPAAPAAQGS